MDNNKEHNSQKKPSPKRKKVSKKVIRQRQLCALAIIALIILIIIILIAKGCSNSGTGEGGTGDAKTTTTTASVVTTLPPETTTTTVTTTVNPLEANVQLDKRELFVNVGDESQSIYARILSYPDENTGEANEVWKSMDESIATVNSWGAVTGVSEGETFIILSFDNHPEIEIEIKVHVASGGALATAESYSEITTFDVGMTEPAPDTPTTPVYGYTEGLDDGNAF